MARPRGPLAAALSAQGRRSGKTDLRPSAAVRTLRECNECCQSNQSPVKNAQQASGLQQAGGEAGGPARLHVAHAFLLHWIARAARRPKAQRAAHCSPFCVRRHMNSGLAPPRAAAAGPRTQHGAACMR